MTSTPHTSSSPAPSGPAGDEALPPAPLDLDTLLTVSLSHPAPGVTVVRAVGEIDRLTVPEWARSLTDACARLAEQAPPGPATGSGDPEVGDRPRLVCDLTGVAFFGATGLAVLVETADHADRLGVALRVVADGRPVRRPLELTALDRVLPVDRHLGPAVGCPAGDRR